MTDVDGWRIYEFETVTVDERGRVVQRDGHTGRGIVEDLGEGHALELMAIPGGRFLMGAAEGEGYPDEHPQRAVRVAPFYLGRYPVTQKQWAAVMGEPARCRFVGDRLPVENVSWRAAREFCRRLALRSRRRYRLPSEAQWEYGCRAGTTTAFAFGPTTSTELANYVGEQPPYRGGPPGIYRHTTTEVGSFPPNAFGLYDMHGNVWEWCADPWHEDYRGAPGTGRTWAAGGDTHWRVLRGGCWHDGPELNRSAARLKFDPHTGDDFIGFRVALARA
jgi:formylglycine-generating enzyme required for sulfatase activity